MKKCGMGKCNACPTLMARTASSNRTMHVPIPSSLTFSLIRHSPRQVSRLKKMIVMENTCTAIRILCLQFLSFLRLACLPILGPFGGGPLGCTLSTWAIEPLSKVCNDRKRKKKKVAFVNQPPTNPTNQPPYPTCQCIHQLLVVFPNCAQCPIPVHGPLPVCGMFGNFRANKNNLGVGSWPKISPIFAPFGPNSIAPGPGAPKA